MKLRPAKETDGIMRDYVETTHFFDVASGKLLEQPAEVPPDPNPESEEGDS